MTPSSNIYYRFVYFNSRGAGEIIRLLLNLPSSSLPKWEDVRYPLGLSQKGFALDSQYQTHKQMGAFACNMDQLPILQVVHTEENCSNNHKLNISAATTQSQLKHKQILKVENIGQSHAIARFLANQHGFMGNTPMEQAQIDNIYENVRDIKSKWFRNVKSSHRTSNENQTAKDTWFQETLPELCLQLESSLPNKISPVTSKNPWLVGSCISLADVSVYHLLGTSMSISTGSTISLFDGESDKVKHAYNPNCERLTESVMAFGALPAIENWERNRPDTIS